MIFHSTVNLCHISTQYRSVESKYAVRSCLKIPTTFGPAPDSISDWGSIPDISQLGLQQPKGCKGMIFVGGESVAISRVYKYFWKKMLLDLGMKVSGEKGESKMG